jgi:multiple sugar transport system permease protein
MFKDARTAALFILPAFAALCLFKLGPMFVSLHESFMFSGISGRRSFVGLENYLYLFTDDPVFWGSVEVTLLFSVLVNPLIVLLSLLYALLLNVKLRFVAFFRTLYFLPAAVSYSVVAVVFGVMFDPYYGLINSIIRLLGLKPQPFFTSPEQALPCIIFLCLWHSTGYWMMFFLAGLQGIPHEIYEAADMDGVSPAQRVFRITLPLLKRTISFVLVSNTAFNLLTFAPVYIITRGGPRQATNLLMYESFKSAFVNLDMGRATAISSILLVVILLISVAELKLTRADFEY